MTLGDAAIAGTWVLFDVAAMLAGCSVPVRDDEAAGQCSRLRHGDVAQLPRGLASVVVKTSCNKTKTETKTALSRSRPIPRPAMRHETSMHC